MAVPVSNETLTLPEWLKWEVDGGLEQFCREAATILAGSGAARTLTTGMVTGTVTASGKITQIDFGALDGTAAASGVFVPASATAQDGTDNSTDGVELVRGPCIIWQEKLVWPAGATQPQIDGALAELAALPGVVLLRGPAPVA